MDSNDLKRVVREKYGSIAKNSSAGESSCCCSNGCCDSADYTVFSENYDGLDGYNSEADMNLGCGIPTQYATIQHGNSVLDLGSGAGNDCFVARAIVGDAGLVKGIDFTDEMIEKAVANNTKLGYTNVSFVKGDIEEMPFADNEFDVVISNCVLNLVPDKRKAFAGIFRVLKPGGHFCVSDVVIKGNLPEGLQKDAEMYAGCVSGAISMTLYLEIIEKEGFVNITLNKQKEIKLPPETLGKYMTENEAAAENENFGIYSITVTGYK